MFFAKRLIIAFLLCFLLPAAAMADHMTGQYSGIGEAAGTYLAVQQSGRTFTGQLSGQTIGTLNGQSDGGENVMGMLTLANGQQGQFQAQHSQQGLTIQIMGDQGIEEYVFVRGGGAQPQPQPQPQPQQPPPNADNGGYYVGANGQQAGPVTRQQVLDALAIGQITPNDLIWKQGMPNWVPIHTLPEFAQATPLPPPLPENGPPPLPGSGGGTPGPIGEQQTGPAGSPLDTEQRKVAAIMLGSTFGIFAHELGHALIGELGIPATGSEEDTVDEFSALVLSAMLRDTTGMSPELVGYLTDVVSYSTLLWHHDSVRAQRQGLELPWYDEHSTGEARFRNTLCIIYGSSPTHFKALADRVQLPDRERGRCETDFAKRSRAWEMIIQPYARNQGGDYPGQQPADAPGAVLKVSYEPSATPFGKQLQGELESLRLFEQFAATLQNLVVWQRDLDVVFADCGTPNAFYDPENARVVMCWEGIEYFFWTVAEPEGITAAGLGLS